MTQLGIRGPETVALPHLNQKPPDDRISDRDFVNIAPLQLGEEVLRVHCARLDEALVTAALYLDARNLKSVCNAQTTREDAQPHQRVRLTRGQTSARKSQFSICFGQRNGSFEIAG